MNSQLTPEAPGKGAAPAADRHTLVNSLQVAANAAWSPGASALTGLVQTGSERR